MVALCSISSRRMCYTLKTSVPKNSENSKHRENSRRFSLKWSASECHTKLLGLTSELLRRFYVRTRMSQLGTANAQELQDGNPSHKPRASPSEPTPALQVKILCFAVGELFLTIGL